LSEHNFTEDSERYTKEGSGKGASVSTGTPLGARKGGCFTGDFERKVKYFLLSGDIVYWGLREICKSLRKRAVVSIGAPLEKL